MKPFYILLVMAVMTACNKGQADPQEVKATITEFSIGAFACAGGYLIEIESGVYKINSLPSSSPYAYYEKRTFPIPVWIRYKKATEGLCVNMGPSIDITSIRPR